MSVFTFAEIFVIIVIANAADNDKWSFVRRYLELSQKNVYVEDNSQWVSNSAKIGRGYNLARGSPVCYTGDCQMNGFARPVFILDYTKRAIGSCDDRLIPQYVDIDCLPSIDSTSSTEIISTLRQLKESTTKGIDVETSVSGSFAGFSASFSYAHSEQTRSMVDTIVKENSTVLFTTLKTSWMRVSLFEPKMNLSDDFRFVIEQMPCCQFDASVEEYVRKYIIDYFGYGYVVDLLLGGIAQQRIIITQSDRTNLEKNGWTVSDETSIGAAAAQIFSTSVKVKRTETYDKEKLDTFSRYSRQDRLTTLGGDISLQSFEDWSKTVKTNPIVIKFGVSLVFNLLTRSRFPSDLNITMKAQLIRTAVEKYLLNPLYCYNDCTHPSHGTCVDSGYFQFGTCKCQSGWTGLDCSMEADDQARVQTETHGICTIWGGFHLVGFPVSPQQANLRLGYWCRATGRILIVKNAFVEFYVNVANSSYGIEYWINNRWVYNIEVIHSYNLIRASTGLCITRLRQCIIESSQRRKRLTSDATATEVCNLFIVEAKKTTKQLAGNVSSRLIPPAREACITDVLSANSAVYGESAVWLVLTNTIRQTPLVLSQRKALMTQISSSIAEAVGRAKPMADFMMRIQ